MDIGIDEVGRGAWAGPMVVGVARLIDPAHEVQVKLRDSKALSKKQRENLYDPIQEAFITACGWVEPAEIDELGLTKATQLAILRALKALGGQADRLLLDGHLNFLIDTPYSSRVKLIIGGDRIEPTIMAAAISAKVLRDRYMVELAETEPGYDFDKHVGYGTSSHLAAIKRLGVSSSHRRSFKPIARLL